jgi:hypothetical protein
MEDLVIVSLKWYPIVGSGDGMPDSVHVIVDHDQTDSDALHLAMEYSTKRPLYPLSCWSPTDYLIVSRKPVEEES